MRMTHIALIVVTATGLRGQPAENKGSFAVASVKRAEPQATVVVDFSVTPGRLTVKNWPLRQLLARAYGLELYQVSGGPDWCDTDLYNIAAKADGNPTPGEILLMLRELLEHRFKVKLHRERVEGKVFALEVAKNGPKLQPSAGGDRDFVGVWRPGAPGSGKAGKIMGKHAPMSLLAEKLTRFAVESQVLDHTGIKGYFDFQFEYWSDDGVPDAGMSLPGALQQSLGLRLKPQKALVETIVIDSAERPGIN